MPNLLIVDDETLIRRSLRDTIVRRYGANIWTVLEADNGRKALETVSAERVDLILTDIKMPLCDGLDMMKKLHALNFDGDVIVVSGFDDYALVRQALKMGATDYLLKPIQEDEMIALLDKALAQLKRSQKQHSFFSAQDSQSHERLRLEQQYQIDQIYAGKETTLEAFPFCRVVLLDVASMDESRTKPSQNQIWEQVTRLLQEKNIKCSYLQGEVNGLWCIMFGAQKREELAVDGPLRECFAQMNLHFAISKAVALSDIRVAFLEDHQQIDGYFYDQPQSKDPRPEPEEVFPYLNLLDRASKALRALDMPQAEKIFQLWFRLLNDDRPRVSRARQELGNFVYRFLDENNAFIRVVGQYALQDGDIITAINTATSFSQLNTVYVRTWAAYLDSYRALNSESEDRYVLHAKEYIAREYSRDLTLTDVANEIGLHPNYFSTFFKQKSGLSFVEYLRGVRIAAACEMLRSSGLRMYEIAEKVGYKDQVQFNRAFKKETGKTPQQWKAGK